MNDTPLDGSSKMEKIDLSGNIIILYKSKKQKLFLILKNQKLERDFFYRKY